MTRSAHAAVDLVRPWFAAARWLLAGGVLGAAAVAVGQGPVALIIACAFLFAALQASPLRRGRHASHRRALAKAEADDVIVYWRPDCTHCEKLRDDLGRMAGDITWVDVTSDERAAEHVASLRDGEVVTPTAVTGVGAQLVATAHWIASHLGRASDTSGGPQC